MLFSSVEFLLYFLPLTILAITLLRWAPARIRVIVILLTSLFFYAYHNVYYLAIILFSILFNHYVGEQLDKNKSRTLLAMGVFINLGLLGFFKYTDFLVGNLNLLGAELPLPGIVLPLAISFFTFQQVAYLVDSYRGHLAKSSFIEYASFVTFFPQLIAGPIVRYQDVIDDIKATGFRIDLAALGFGLSIFVMGLAKKVVLADSFGDIADPVFNQVDAGTAIDSSLAWLGLLAYTLQIYFDFSAYSDMAIGLGFVFGLQMPLNFNSPYKARSITEFWQRWHITLSTFLRDYLYIPLGGNKQGFIRQIINIFVVMLLGGLWHGAGWSFVLWGALHGFYIVTNHSYRHLIKHFSILHFIRGPVTAIAPVLTFLCVVLAWVPFRASDTGFLSYYTYLFTGDWSAVPEQSVMWVAFGLGLCWLTPNVAEIFGYFSKESKAIWRPDLAWLALIGGLFAIAILNVVTGEPHEFIYFQF